MPVYDEGNAHRLQIRAETSWTGCHPCVTLNTTTGIKVLQAILQSDDILRNEIQDRTGKPISFEEELEADIEKPAFDDQDDTSVPLEAIIHEEFGVKLDGLSLETAYCHKASAVIPFNETDCIGLTSSAAEEDIWSYDDQGNLWATLRAK